MVGVGIFGAGIAERNNDIEIGERNGLLHRKNKKNVCLTLPTFILK
ncbi:MAG: hypothetical protein UX49_C0016G0006 [Candidatus Wolfebacteria bacterium GW2011_GWC2_46_275]|nr:MAG: hypothetical protein UX49_C0016G0006 [Candidatus Wolfebacteria bacterium GW2011_GWC2_46_275]KKU41726.1 MAG: hypothetical protein UX58_C0006G0035 [Candidatus Wolfebacteria bacterium GW2011_GWB2_46_69]KKU53980.1 MAG: hypothetical protein UX76_C0007G0039 [Candidatus Wolfebacteria bacterium GW2011_GWC1_47_103]KKU72078.1 MAG: hypothetical protein UX96_C0017G0006 [Candidatus Wolfebacteria bacterium GW2011_GWB1_47_243]